MRRVMVLPEARAELREALSALVAGRLSNDGFDDVYYRLCVRSPDRAVEEIGQFGWGLYSSDLLWPYYLTGRHATTAEARAVAERCDLFLRSGLEYEWPRYPALGWVLPVQAIVVAPGCLVSLFAGMLVPVALSNSAWGGAGVIAAVAVLAVVPGVWAYRGLGRYAGRQWEAFWSCGPREAWPFFSASALQRMCSEDAEPGAAPDPAM
ncbi:hypothetical protein R5W24_004704 [Gemmata sp. JC717]|uniref:hypothetical protein n=1 Tax=Gemmata algarum TaxID=2975278 RepID=UPI0021BB25B8|nr:hypothetical protein [Gemmata algarum]MDY3555561.1 hypothetical protein [Gemmata algarum]